jgi:hypothetical protein
VQLSYLNLPHQGDEMNLLKAGLPTIFAFAALVALPYNANAFELEQVSARAGTLGVGGEIGVEVLPTLVLRGVVQGYKYNYNKTLDGINYDGKLGLSSYGLQADFHPPLIPLYITAGMYANDNKVDLNAVPSGTYTIGDNTYTGAQVGTLTSHAGFDKTAIYGGLGLEFQLGPVATVLEGGVYYQGKPQITSTVSGPIASNSAFQQDLAKETAQLEDKLDKAKYYPAITIMGRWKF